MVRSKRIQAGRKAPPRRQAHRPDTRGRVIALHAKHPDAGVADIAELVGVTRQRVMQIAIELGLEFKPRRGKASEQVVSPAPPTPEAVREWRLEHGDITQAHLAAMLGVSIDTVARWERGERPTSGLLTLALAELVNV